MSVVTESKDIPESEVDMLVCKLLESVVVDSNVEYKEEGVCANCTSLVDVVETSPVLALVSWPVNVSLALVLGSADNVVVRVTSTLAVVES